MRETIDCTLEDFGDVVFAMLEEFSQEVCDGLKEVAEESTEDLVQGTVQDAPKDRPKFNKAIAKQKVSETATAVTWAWYVKAPHHRLTHLVAFGHGIKNGGRTKSNDFLKTNYERVKREYEKKCEKVIDDAAG